MENLQYLGRDIYENTPLFNTTGYNAGSYKRDYITVYPAGSTASGGRS
jgi:hypothetical protein